MSNFKIKVIKIREKKIFIVFFIFADQDVVLFYQHLKPTNIDKYILYTTNTILEFVFFF